MGGHKTVFRLSSFADKHQQQPKHRRSRCVRHAPFSPAYFKRGKLSIRSPGELERASAWLDQQPELLDMIGACVPGCASGGRPGLTCETILRCAVLMHLMGYSYRGLEFALLDSASVQRFARVDPFRVPKKSALQSAVGAIDADAWQAINGVLLQDAKQQGIESGTQVRIDSTVTETDILEPSDSRLLYDGVRVLGADAAAAAGGARAAAAGVGARPLPCGQAARAGDPLGARRAAAGGHLPAAAEPGGADDGLHCRGTG